MSLVCSMWDLGIKRVVQNFLEDPEIRALVKLKEHRTTGDAQTFYGSQHFKDLDEDCAGALTSDAVSSMLISIGGDGVQLLNWGTRTATVIAVKLEDLPTHMVQTGRAVAPLIIIEGPDEPSNLNHILRQTVDDLLWHAPSYDGEGVSYTVHIMICSITSRCRVHASVKCTRCPATTDNWCVGVQLSMVSPCSLTSPTNCTQPQRTRR